MPEPTPPVNTTGTPPAAAWTVGLEGVEADLLGYVANRGWDKLDPAKAALEAARAHREASKMIGVPAEQLLKLPADRTDATAMRVVWEQLGAPKDAAEYKFEGIQVPGDGATERFIEHARGVAAKVGLPAGMAQTVAAEFAGFLNAREEAAKTVAAGEAQQAVNELKANWGANYDVNRFTAIQAAKALSARMGPMGEKLAGALSAFEGQAGSQVIMEMFRAIGSAIGEDKLVLDPSGGTTGVMTRDQAVAMRQQLESDQGWVKRYLAKDTEAMKQMEGLLRIITSGQ